MNDITRYEWGTPPFPKYPAETVDSMAEIGEAFMDAMPEGYIYNQSPAEIIADLTNERDDALAEVARLKAERDTPHTIEFLKAVELEALHQRARWAAPHDAGKSDADWFWLIGYLAGKALHSGSQEARELADNDFAAAHRCHEKLLHHIITTAAACLNWHAGKTGNDTRMRPGIDPASTNHQDPTTP